MNLACSIRHSILSNSIARSCSPTTSTTRTASNVTCTPLVTRLSFGRLVTTATRTSICSTSLAKPQWQGRQHSISSRNSLTTCLNSTHPSQVKPGLNSTQTSQLNTCLNSSRAHLSWARLSSSRTHLSWARLSSSSRPDLTSSLCRSQTRLHSRRASPNTSLYRTQTRLNSSSSSIRSSSFHTSSSSRISSSESSSPHMASFFQADDWAALRAQYKAHDEQREALIKRCRDVQKGSKQAIFCLHRHQLDACTRHLQAAEAALKELLPLTQQYPSLRLGSYSNCLEEFTEAYLLRVYLAEGRIAARSEIPLASTEEYLGGLLDFAGELNRQAVPAATNRDKETLAKYRALIMDMVEKFTLLDMKNPNLRKKMGPLHATLNKLEYMLYELSLTENSAIKHVDDSLTFVSMQTDVGAVGDESER